MSNDEGYESDPEGRFDTPDDETNAELSEFLKEVLWTLCVWFS